MKAILVLKFSKKTNDGKQIFHGVYESIEEFTRLQKLNRGVSYNTYHDSEFMYQCLYVPFFTNGGTKADTKNGESTVSQRVLQTVHYAVPKKRDRKYNFMSIEQAQNSHNQKIAVLCGGDYSTVKFENDY